MGGFMKNGLNNERKYACHCLNIRRAGQAVTNRYDQYLMPSGLSVSQFSLLHFLANLRKVSVSKLAIEMRLDRTTLVRNLKPLEEKGLVVDVASEGKNRQLELTEVGREIHKNALRLWKAAQNDLEQLLGKEFLEALSLVTQKIENAER
jgi:DNA-binding MarR family transcriptional regulator